MKLRNHSCYQDYFPRYHQISSQASVLAVGNVEPKENRARRGIIEGFDWVVKNHKKADGPAIISASIQAGYSRASNEAGGNVDQSVKTKYIIDVSNLLQ